MGEDKKETEVAAEPLPLSSLFGLCEDSPVDVGGGEPSVVFDGESYTFNAKVSIRFKSRGRKDKVRVKFDMEDVVLRDIEMVMGKAAEATLAIIRSR